MVARRRIRSVKPEFFGDEKVCALSRDARYLAVGLITLADDRGRLRDRPLEILGTLFPEEQVSIAQIRKWLGEIVHQGLALRYMTGEHSYLWLPQFMRHQVVDKPTESELPPHPDDGLAGTSIKEAYKQAKRREDSTSDSRALDETSTRTRRELDEMSSSTPALRDNSCTPVLLSVPGEKKTVEEQQEDDARAARGEQRELVRRVFDAWLVATGRSAKRTDFSEKRQRVISKALVSHGVEDCLAAVTNIGRDEWARGANDRNTRFDEVEHALGDATRIERWRDWTPPAIRAAATGKESPSDMWRAMDEAKASRESSVIEGKELSRG